MSMPALLSHFGINTARFVTAAGEIVFDGVSTTANGFSHATHGLVTPVATHTFHGGEKEPYDRTCGPAAGWEEGEQLNRHVEAMKRAFPNFGFVPPSDDLAPCWIGEINTGRGRFTIAIILRRGRGLPSVCVVDGPPLGVNAGRKWVPSPHLYLDGSLCVADRGDWNPDEHTAATVAAWAAHWLAAYTEWRMSRRWPVEGVRTVAS